jgi:hypothetical protein
MSLTFIAPFTLATIKGLRPDKIAEWLIQRGDYDSLDELIRKAVNDGLITVIDYSLTLLVIKGKTQLENSGGKVETAERLSSLLLSIGRHSYQRYNPDSVAQVMVRFTELVSYCNEYPRYWRNAADFFNEAAIELYAYSEEWIGRSK